ncbi:DUF397 domain-containing protein [Streptomyces sp. NPDC051567]|uniref:DUF397 domain-containing protein n=1 Tax=Streptomyces sp. NPDC051567 TaxID=3365660 RepID=UPI0037BD198D
MWSLRRPCPSKNPETRSKTTWKGKSVASKAGLRAPDLGPVAWQKSSYSGAGEAQCVEVADLTAVAGEGVAIRDSKRADGPALVVDRKSFSRFVASIGT